jgi:hypothetical protein
MNLAHSRQASATSVPSSIIRLKTRVSPVALLQT